MVTCIDECVEEPGTRLTTEQFEALKRHIGQEVQIAQGTYEREGPYTLTERFVFEGALGYRMDGGYVVTHIICHNGKPLILCLNAWRDCIENVEDLQGNRLLENRQPYYYYRTKEGEPHPEIVDKIKRHYHEPAIDISFAVRSEYSFLSREFLERYNRELKPEDLRGREIMVLN